MEKKVFYSNDGGATWEGPFSREELAALMSAGVVGSSALVRGEGESLAPPSATPPLGGAPGAAAAPQAQGAVDENVRNISLGVNGKTYGPYSLKDLRTMRLRGELADTARYWMQGMPDWRPIGELFGVSASPGIADDGEGLVPLQGFSLGKFFSSVFKHHSRQEMLELFCCGSPSTTPPLRSVVTSWPTPWMFARLLLVCLALYFGFNWACVEFENPLLEPGIIFVGNFGVPFCVFILFFELNVRREVPLYDGIKAMVAGGLLSLIVSLFFFQQTETARSAMGASWAGPVEETGKLLAVILIAGGMRNGRVLTGLLLGCAVGTGFAAFESAGYVYVRVLEVTARQAQALMLKYQGANAEQVDMALSEIIRQLDPNVTLWMRAFLAPFGHVVWTAITAGAFWMVQGLRIREGQRKADDDSYGLGALGDIRFLRIAVIPILLHMFWNSPLLVEHLYMSRIAAGVIAWIVALRLVQVGLRQVREEQKLQPNK